MTQKITSEMTEYSKHICMTPSFVVNVVNHSGIARHLFLASNHLTTPLWRRNRREASAQSHTFCDNAGTHRQCHVLVLRFAPWRHEPHPLPRHPMGLRGSPGQADGS